ncbi:MAG: TetR/AcrR family transcriptional regulator, partial [Anaerolineales bacterium]|nr:TetR/AcrR family transcriptional regulator [Anaerolineales bacterium]
QQTFFNLPAEKQAAILALAIEEFAEHTYKTASISRIVARAGIAKGSFYQYFADKKDLYLYLLEMITQEKTQFFQQNAPPTAETGIFAYIRWLLDVGVRFEFTNPQLAQIGYRAMYGDAPLPLETKAVLQQGMLPYFRQLVEQGQEQGVLAANIDPDVAAFMFNAVFSNLGDYLLRRLAVAPEALLHEEKNRLAAPEAQLIFEQILSILESGMGTKGTI